MRKYINRGFPPKDPNVELGIEWANGRESRHTFRAEQLDFRIRGQDFDVAKFWRVDGKFEDESVIDELKQAG